MEVDRMRLARVRSPEEDDVGLLRFAVRARAAPRPEYRRQTDDARGVSGAVTAVDVVAAESDAGELLREVVDLVGRLRAGEEPEGLRSVRVAHSPESVRRAV